MTKTDQAGLRLTKKENKSMCTAMEIERSRKIRKKPQIIEEKPGLYQIFVVGSSMKKCSKCKKVKSTIDYHGKQYCTWYCVKKK